MRKRVKLKLWGFFGVFVIVFLFVLFSYLVQTNLDFFESMIVGGVFGMFIYVLLKIIATVFTPVTALPFIGVAVKFWGFAWAVFLTVLGWTIGGALAFWIARRFGVPVIRKFISLEEIYRFEDRVNIGNSFWSVILLRMIVPVDILSWALGFFSKMDFWKYNLATFIGVIPFALVFAYLGGVSYIYQIVIGLLFLIGVLLILILRELRLVFAK